jgi:hypothetical protein
VVLDGEQHHDDRHQPHKPRSDREPDPQGDVAQVERITDDGKRSRDDKGPEAIASRPRDRPDVMNGPQADRFTDGSDGDPQADQQVGR